MAGNLTIEHKRGDTFLYDAALKETATGPAIDITDWVIAAQIRAVDLTLIEDITVTVTDAAQGEYELYVADTTTWPIGKARMDVQYTDNTGVIRSTETIDVKIIQDQTFAA
jgi:hypothetical protein